MFHNDSKLMRSIFTPLLAAVLCGLFLTASAQAGRQVIIANGNLFAAGNYATVAAYNLNSRAYQVFDSIPARSVQDVLIQGNVAYVAADSLIVRYNIDTYTETASVVARGVRKLAFWDNKLVATMGFGANADFVRVYDGNTLNPIYGIAGLSGECEGIAIWGDTAIVAVPVGFGSPNGKIALIDLAAQTLRTEVDLDTNGRSIERLYVQNGKIWALSTIAYLNPFSVLTEFDPTSLAHTSHRVDYPALGSVGVFGGLYFVRRATGLFTFNVTSATVQDTLLFDANGYAAGVINLQTSDIFLTITDYFSFGNLHHYNYNAGSIQDTLVVGISPEALAIDYRAPVGIAEPAAQQLGLWPNPATDFVEFRVDAPLRNARLHIVDALGRTVRTRAYTQVQGARLPVDDLPAGLYLVVLRSGDQQFVGRFLK